ncbi:TrmH family RNA methyltransferase [Tepidiphilus baoligensis]|uniref:RNA methyltransferase n=1 Tax=Tepidiphilus baoligensis TaxID=2698687 RepID=A0ABX1QK58_9PROT|nr:RNA methyltransferase [Tepidiphilus baoligensis]NMH16326.1 RNA methyltransferase [Tepidiphilus baoligensis]
MSTWQEIRSRDNPQVRAIRRWLNESSFRKREPWIVLEGDHLLTAALQAGWMPEAVFIEEGREARFAAVLEALPPACARIRVASPVFRTLAATETPAGIVARFARRTLVLAPQELAGRDLVLLDGVQEPGNVGAILRTAAAAGVGAVLLGPGCADPWAPKVLRAAMGAHFVLPFAQIDDPAPWFATRRGRVFATALAEKAVPLYTLDLRAPALWLFGTEGAGVRPEWLAMADACVRIPMPGAMESLNVAAAAAVCLFEAVRQRNGRGIHV